VAINTDELLKLLSFNLFACILWYHQIGLKFKWRHRRAPSTIEFDSSLTSDFLFLDNNLIAQVTQFFCRAMLHASAAYVVMRCPSVCMSVCLSVTFVNSVKKNKHIFNTFSLSGSHTILVFRYQTLWQYRVFRQHQPNGGVECTCGRHNSRFWTNSWISIDGCSCGNNNCDGGRCSLSHRAPRISESMFITTSMVDHDEEKRTKQNLILRSRKSEAELALGVLYYWSYWQTRSIARPLCNSGATCWESLTEHLVWSRKMTFCGRRVGHRGGHIGDIGRLLVRGFLLTRSDDISKWLRFLEIMHGL